MYRTVLISGVLCAAVICGAVARGDAGGAPAHWFVSSQRPGEGVQHYVASRDSSVAYSGSSSGMLKSKFYDPDVSGTLMQGIHR
jgi:hypothetical protein